MEKFIITNPSEVSFPKIIQFLFGEGDSNRFSSFTISDLKNVATEIHFPFSFI